MKAVKIYFQAETQEQNVYELFAEYLSSVYFDGYAEQLAESDPSAFNFELTQFINNTI